MKRILIISALLIASTLTVQTLGCKEFIPDKYAGQAGCLKCEDGYSRMNVGSQSFKIFNCLKCKSQKHCLTCGDGGICNKCKERYSPDVNGFCVLNNDPNCSFEFQGVCRVCVPGYVTPWLGNRMYPCKKLPDHCFFNTQDGRCNGCEEGYRLNQETSISKNLRPLKLRAGGATCQACSDPGCAKCDESVAQCTKCDSTHYQVPASGSNSLKDNYSCKSCSSHCSRCTTKDTCISCETGFYLNGKGGATQTCEACPEGCKDCKTKDTCSICEDGLYFSPETKKCQKIDCKVKDCLKCGGSSTLCLVCKNKFFAQVTAQKQGEEPTVSVCKPCTGNCLQCRNEKNCGKCGKGMKIEKAKCIEDLDDGISTNTYMLFGGITILALIILVFAVKHFSKRKEERDDEEDYGKVDQFQNAKEETIDSEFLIEKEE